jgi:undecaprenyl-diphosphatase
MNEFTQRLIKKDLDWSGRLAIWKKKSPLRTLAIIITRSGDGLPVGIAYGLAFFLTWNTPARDTVLAIFAADMLTFIIVQVMKWRVKRPRPEGTWGKTYRKVDPNSFPSGHSARGGVILMMALLLGPPWFTIAGVVWGVAVALSRVLMGVHYLSDMVVGFTIGMVVALVVGLALGPFIPPV